MRPSFAAILLLLFPLLSAAQPTAPQWEIYGGYQLMRLDTSAAQDAADKATTPFALPRVNIGDGLNMNGWAASVAENTTSWFGGVIEASANYANKNIDLSQLAAAIGLAPPGTQVIASFKPRVYTFAAGPQFGYRRSSRFQPFVHLLFGATHIDMAPQGATRLALAAVAPQLDTTDTAFTLIAGGGVDVPFHRGRLALRAQGDYVRSYLYSQFTNDQANFRVNAGLVLRFGKR